MLRRLLNPRSTLSLTLLGFSVVTLPLFVALGLTAFYVDRVAEQGRTSVNSAAQAMLGSSRLSQALNGMERNARQYLLLGETQLLTAYQDNHEAFQANVTRLSELMADSETGPTIDAIGRRESALYAKLSAPNPREALNQEGIADAFDELRELAMQIRGGTRALVDDEVERMQGMATTTKEWLFWLGTALIPLTMISAAVFTALIARPIRRLDQAIRQLGDSGFDHKIAIEGPEDLRALGERLEWLRQRLKELENEKARFLRHVSHELKTPLTAIRESGALLDGEAAGPLNDEQREITGILNDSGRQLQGLIENLLDFARTQTQQRPLALSDVDIAQIVNAVLRDHQPEARAKELTVRTHLRACHLRADETKLKTILDNIISNAVKFSPEKGHLTVTAVESRQWVSVTITDTGPGIPEEERHRIFEAFVQGGTSNTGGQVKGSGLGLSIAREYARAHGGHIVIAEPGGRGSRIRVELPQKPPEQRRTSND